MADSSPFPPSAGAFLDCGGKPYLIPRLNQDDKRFFHAWANAQALADLRALEPLCCGPRQEPTPERPITQAEYLRELSAVRDAVTGGHYAYHEAGGITRRSTSLGVAYLCWTAMRRADPSVTWADVERVAEADPDLLYAKYCEANADPNPPALASGQGTLIPGTGGSS